MKKEKNAGEKMPVWKPEKFLRLAGMGDALLHKARISRTEQEGTLLHSGRMVRLQCSFQCYQDAMMRYLLSKLHPLQTEAYALLLHCDMEIAQTEPKMIEADSTHARKKAQEIAARRREKRAEAEKNKVRLVNIYQEIRYECDLVDYNLQETLNEINREIAIYAKATRFAVVQNEVPTIKRTQEAFDIVDKQLMRKLSALVNSTDE